MEATYCLTPGCLRNATRRGLCIACRAAARRLITSGETTEDEMISMGLLLTKHSRARKGLLAQEFEKRKHHETKKCDRSR
jgi:hypothetical protein